MTTIDDIGMRAGEAARADAQAMARSLADSGLRQLRSGDGAVVAMPSRDPRPRRWAALAAAVALAAAAVVAIVLYANNGHEKAIVPATDVTTPPTAAPQTTATPTTATPGTTTDTAPPQTTVPAVIAPDAIKVDYTQLPPTVTPTSVTTLDQGVVPLVAIGESWIVTVVGQQATMISSYLSGGSPPQLAPLPVTPTESIAVVGDVLYAFVAGDGGTLTIDAIALTGDRVGQVLASAPTSLTASGVSNTGALGRGPNGIIDRTTGAQLIGYVDTTGAPMATLGRPSHNVAIASGDPTRGDVTIHDPDGTHDWHLFVGSDPSVAFSLVQGTGQPFPSSRGGAVMWIPVDTSHAVIAVLAADGSGQWYSLADGWQVGASDLDGTILVRVNNGKIELGRLDPPQRLDFLNQPLAPNERVAYAETKPTTLTSAQPCTLDQLKLEPGSGGAMGTVYGTLYVRNQSDSPCSITGVPDVGLLDDAGNVVQSTDPSTLGTTGDTLILEHDSWVMSELGPIASNVCGGNQSSQFRFTLAGVSTTVPFANGGPVQPDGCTPPPTDPGSGHLNPSPFTVVPPNDGGYNPFDGVQISLDVPGSVHAGETLHYDVVVSTDGDPQPIADPFCPIYTETIANASAQYLLDCNGSDGVLVTKGDPVVFHIELPIPADATPGPATLTWTAVEPAATPVTATVTILA